MDMGFPSEEQPQPFSEMERLSQVSPRAGAVLTALTQPMVDYVLRKYTDEQYVVGDDGETHVNPTHREQTLNRVALIGDLVYRTLSDIRDGSEDTFESLDVVKNAAISAYTRDRCPVDFFLFSGDDSSTEELTIQADELLAKVDTVTSQAADEIDSFLGFLCIYFDEPRPGIDY